MVGPVKADIQVFEGNNRSAGSNPHLARRYHEGALLVESLNFRLDPGKLSRIVAGARFATLSHQPFAAAQVSIEVTHVEDIIWVHVFGFRSIIDPQQSPFGHTRSDGIHVETAVGGWSSSENSKKNSRRPGHPRNALGQAQYISLQRQPRCGRKNIRR
jgi:hypothetical protein